MNGNVFWYVPIVDEEAESNAQDVTVKLPNDTKTTITKITHSVNKELFLVRSIVVKNHVAKDLGLYAEAEGHEKEMEKCQIIIDRYYQDPEAEQQDQALEDYTKLEKLRDEVVKKMLDTFRHFIHEDVRHIFDDVLSSKLNVTPWVNLYGVEETEEELGFTLWAFDVVWMFWMRSVFQVDAADNTLEYLLYIIKKPRFVAPRIFVRRVKQLSSYITYLPGAYYSSQATSQTTGTEKLTDLQVAQLALRLCPPAWKTAWKMLMTGMPQDLEEIIQFMALQEFFRRLISTVISVTSTVALQTPITPMIAASTRRTVVRRGSLVERRSRTIASCSSRRSLRKPRRS